MGSSTLSYLASHPALPPHSSLHLIESASRLAPAASGKAGGFLAEDWHGAATASLASLSFRLQRELAERAGGKDKWGYRDVETLSVEYDATGSDKKGRGRKSGGGAGKVAKEVDWIDAEHIAGSSRLGGGGTTAQVTPGKLIEHLVQEAQQLGSQRDLKVDVRLGTTAKSLELDGDGSGKVSGLVVSSGEGEESIPITDVVIAAGPWTGTLVKKLFPSARTSSRLLSSATQVTGSRAHSVIIKASRPTSNHCLFTDMRFSRGPGKGTSAAAPEVYARADGTVYVCGGGDDEPLPATAEEVVFDGKKTSDLVEQSAVLAPEVLSIEEGKKGGGATLVAEQACYLPMAAGNMLLGGDAKTGIWLTAGASCWGITLGLGTGSVMADLILTGKTEQADIRQLQG